MFVFLTFGVLVLLYFVWNKKTPGTDILDKKLAVDYDVVICGAGATGVLLAITLEKKGIKTIVLEKRNEPTKHSKAIGIHPIAFEIFEEIDPKLVTEFEKVGLKVYNGICLGNGYDHVLGRLKIDIVRKPYNFIMSCEQYKTEEILRTYYLGMGGKIIMGSEICEISMSRDADFARISYKENDKSVAIKSHFVIGCDGKESFIRKSCGIKQHGSKYLDTFMMGDFDDNTDYRQEAALFLTDWGLVESFPLPSGLRRWVCSTDTFVEKPSLDQIVKIVKDRTKYDISQMKNYMLSSYQVAGLVSETYHNDRFVLVGDAAHICSPLGGQGMNLGWLDVQCLSKVINDIFFNSKSIKDSLESYDEEQIIKANAVVQRSEMYMLLGRKPKYLWLRNVIVGVMLIQPLQYYIASFFSMRYLGIFSCRRKTLF